MQSSRLQDDRLYGLGHDGAAAERVYNRMHAEQCKSGHCREVCSLGGAAAECFALQDVIISSMLGPVLTLKLQGSFRGCDCPGSVAYAATGAVPPTSVRLQ